MSGFVSFLEPGGTSSSAGRGDAAPPPAGVPAEGNSGKRAHIRKANMIEDGHSLAEQAVYDALWKAAAPASPVEQGDRTVRIGYRRLAQMTRLSWVSVKANLKSLEHKLAIEVIGSENSATRQGKTYRVYSPGSIMERRRKAGLEWVRRTRGVELLSQVAAGSRR
jgi:hypothetical protein